MCSLAAALQLRSLPSAGHADPRAAAHAPDARHRSPSAQAAGLFFKNKTYTYEQKQGFWDKTLIKQTHIKHTHMSECHKTDT